MFIGGLDSLAVTFLMSGSILFLVLANMMKKTISHFLCFLELLLVSPPPKYL